MPSTTNAIQILKEDHRSVEELFSQFEKTGPRAKKSRETLVRKVIEALAVHAFVEESTFYPEVRRRVESADAEVLEALEEHHIVKWTLSELDGMDADDERFVAKVTVLMEMVRHHVKEEERDLFPKVRAAMTRAELDELGDAMKAARSTASKRPHPRSPDEPPTNILAAAMTGPVDAARSAGEAAIRKVLDFAHR
jgi:hemerythrin superfamily protein